MRPSNKRSRSKQNRPRSLGNIVNRVFDSSGPEGKVRGTPQQIIDKYQVLARDAQLSGDRVAAENFLQHSEHYQRMLNEAQAELQRETDQRREQHQPGSGQSRRHDDRDSGDQPERFERGGDRPGDPRQGEARQIERHPERQNDPRQNDPRQADRQNDPRQNEPRQNEPRQGDPRQGDPRQNDPRQNDPRQGEGRMDWLGRRNRRHDGRNRPEGAERNGGALPVVGEESMLVETPEARADRQAAAAQPPAQPAVAPSVSPALSAVPATQAGEPAAPSARVPSATRPAAAEVASEPAADVGQGRSRKPRAARPPAAEAPAPAAEAPRPAEPDPAESAKRAPRRRRSATADPAADDQAEAAGSSRAAE